MEFERAYSKRVHIIRFKDGDTMVGHVSCETCGHIHEETFRLPHIESWEPIGPDARKAVQTSIALTEKFRGVKGIVTANKSRRDRYGRLIADVLIDGELLSNLIVQSGHAWYGVGTPEHQTT